MGLLAMLTRRRKVEPMPEKALRARAQLEATLAETEKALDEMYGPPDPAAAFLRNALAGGRRRE